MTELQLSKPRPNLAVGKEKPESLLHEHQSRVSGLDPLLFAGHRVKSDVTPDPTAGPAVSPSIRPLTQFSSPPAWMGLAVWTGRAVSKSRGQRHKQATFHPIW